ncbi:DNA polymerase III subunit gamma/tau [Endozoicomonadaceae bacterium StTr2]
MSYQVLARKWRPKTFKELVGQVHVLKALVNALDTGRLHHAYLFTGTRGVGKTTIARILAKCLNCEQGVSSEPCGVCSACTEIDEGRFVDLIEVDAASRTRVDDTRELLDNVQYAPTRGRYKVYLIDEVHMLSMHSFNALLKTLEEPPPHIKFLLATTDPQKLPVTILSRCLQFGLKNMSPERIVGHLDNVLQEEKVSFEQEALWQLGRAADGSMRDALSLTDQAIAFGNGNVTAADVSSMLGTIDRSQVLRLVELLIGHNGSGMLQAVAELAEHAPDYASVLAEMLSVLHHIAIGQSVPGAVDNSQGDGEKIKELAGRATAEDVHLFYQVGMIGRRDLPLAPDPRTGFEMALLRMLAFRPDGAPAEQPLLPGSDQPDNTPPVEPVADAGVEHKVPEAPVDTGAESKSDSIANNDDLLQAEPAPVVETAPEPVAEVPVQESPAEAPQPLPDLAPQEEPPHPADMAGVYDSGMPPEDSAPAADLSQMPPAHAEVAPEPQVVQPEVETAPPAVKQEPEPKKTEPSAVAVNPELPAELPEKITPGNWWQVFELLGLRGVTGTIASHCELVSAQPDRIELRLDQSHATLHNPTHDQRITKAMSELLGHPIQVAVTLGTVVSETPAARRIRLKAERLQLAKDTIYADNHVQQLVERFAAQVIDESIAPRDPVNQPA